MESEISWGDDIKISNKRKRENELSGVQAMVQCGGKEVA